MRTRQFIPFAVVSLAATLHGQGSITSQSEFWLNYRNTPVIAVGSTFDDHSQRPEERPTTLVPIHELRNPLGRRDQRHIQRAIATADRGHHHAAIDQLERLLHNHSKTRAYVTSIRGAEYLELGEWDGAEADLREAVQLLPNVQMNHFNYALVLIRKGRIEAAQVHAMRSLQLGYSLDSARLLRVIEELRREQGRP
jgi:tetratricopeptide (TPR) repeat protein